MPIRFWVILVLSLLAGMLVLRSRPAAGGRRGARDAWHRRIKPPAPPPVPPGPRQGS